MLSDGNNPKLTICYSYTYSKTQIVNEIASRVRIKLRRFNGRLLSKLDEIKSKLDKSFFSHLLTTV